MTRVIHAEKQTKNRFLNMYELTVSHRNGSTGSYYVASRSEETGGITALEHRLKPAGVMLFGVYRSGGASQLVLERQFRYPIDDYVYELPAGLIEKGESLAEAAKREAFEETGLIFEPVSSQAFSRPFYMSPGMTDEACATVYGYFSGEPTSIHEEEDEDIQVVLADRDECRRILSEERVSITCAYQLMHFIGSDDPLAFLKDDNATVR